MYRYVSKDLKKESGKKMRNIKYYIKLGSITLLVVVIIGYGWFRGRDLFYGPIIIIDSPAETSTTTGAALLDMHGTAKSISFLYLNGRQIFTDNNGAWQEKVLLHRGYNVIEIRAVDRFGREARRVVQAVQTE